MGLSADDARSLIADHANLADPLFYCSVLYSAPAQARIICQVLVDQGLSEQRRQNLLSFARAVRSSEIAKLLNPNSEVILTGDTEQGNVLMRQAPPKSKSKLPARKPLTPVQSNRGGF